MCRSDENFYSEVLRTQTLCLDLLQCGRRSFDILSQTSACTLHGAGIVPVAAFELHQDPDIHCKQSDVLAPMLYQFTAQAAPYS
jgi:hypothetical protein